MGSDHGCLAGTLTSFTAAEIAHAGDEHAAMCGGGTGGPPRNDGHWRFRIGWLRWAATVLRDVPIQTVQVWKYLLGPRRRGVISVVNLPAEPERLAAGRRALAVLAFATTPGTVVLDCDSHDGVLMLHRVRPGPGRLETVVKR
ncbi:Na+/H+ antiporter subunit E [Mycolicibacterium vaccae]|nr:Na+/H+ antiporter subunit E [Mycolicibacterium vaccae]